MKRLHLVLLAGCLALLLASCGGQGGGNWGGNNEDVEKRDPLVEVVPAVKDNISAFERSTGRIEAHDIAAVHAQVSEVALEVNAEVGDAVQKDQVLARLESRKLELALSAARIALEESELAHRKNLLDAEKKKADLERIEKYFDPANPEGSRLFSKDAYDAARLEHNKAVNACDSSQLALTRAQGEVASAALSLSHCVVRAPISGVVTERGVRANELVGSNALLFRIADFSILEVKLDVAEASLKDLREAPRTRSVALFGLRDKVDLGAAQPVLMTVTAFPDERFLGYVDRISPTVDQARGMVVVTVRLLAPRVVEENTHGQLLRRLDPDARKGILGTANRARQGTAVELRPGMWVDARIATSLTEDAVLAPGAALVGDAEVIWVVVPDAKDPTVGTARRIDVAGRRGIGSEGRFELKPAPKGREEEVPVAPGSLVVVRGQSLLRDRQRVRIRDLSR